MLSGSESAGQDNTPARIRSAAVAPFREFGYHGTSVRALADAVGIEPPSLYHHFESKQQIADEYAAIVLTLVRARGGAGTIGTATNNGAGAGGGLCRLHPRALSGSHVRVEVSAGVSC